MSVLYDPEKHEIHTMMAHARGHPIQARVVVDKQSQDWVGTIGKWHFADTGEEFETGHIPERPCAHCGKMALPGGEDACLGHLPGVSAACCGHGVEDGCIFYDDGREESIPKEE